MYLDEHAIRILEDIFTIHDGSKVRKNTAFLKALRKALSETEYPTLDDVWGGAGRDYADSTKKQNRSWITRSGLLDGDTFGSRFWSEYQSRWEDYTTKKVRMALLKSEAPLRHTYDVEVGYDYPNTMEIIKENPQVTYRLANLPVRDLYYFDTHHVQIIKMNHVGGNPVVQLPLSFHYRCNKCDWEDDLPYDAKSVPCTDNCGGGMTRVKSQDIVRPAYASRVITDDRNSISIISITEIPQGEFIGAVFLCRNKADYYLFMIATEEIEPTNNTIRINQDSHAIWQIIDQIDQIHEERIGKHIVGLDWYKASILLAYLANCKGRVSTNIMVVGGAGLGKTSTARLYMATLTPQQKVQPMDDLTGPGLRGSTAQIKVGDTTISVPEPGLVVRHKMIVIDELLGSKNPILNSLKTTLVSSTVNVEVSGNRTQTPKYATAIATSNLVEEVGLEQSRWMLRWIKNEDEDPSNEFTVASANKAMVNEWRLRGLDWHTGLSFPHIDRWPILFFINDSSDELTDSDLDGSDEEIDDLELAKLLYTPAVDEYFNFCGRVSVDWKSHTLQIKELINDIRGDNSIVRDQIHSKRRISQNITLMLQLSAQINGRSELTDEDFAFVRELWSKTCEWIDVSELAHAPTTSQRAPTEWTIETIKSEVHTLMTGYTSVARYYHTSTGYSMISDAICEMGADPGLVDVVIEKYRQNPNQ